jgi:hypothetical protein
VLAALAGVVHDCERADDDENNRDEDKYPIVLHRDLPTVEAPGRYLPNFRASKMNAR